MRKRIAAVLIATLATVVTASLVIGLPNWRQAETVPVEWLTAEELEALAQAAGGGAGTPDRDSDDEDDDDELGDDFNPNSLLGTGGANPRLPQGLGGAN